MRAILRRITFLSYQSGRFVDKYSIGELVIYIMNLLVFSKFIIIAIKIKNQYF